MPGFLAAKKIGKEVFMRYQFPLRWTVVLALVAGPMVPGQASGGAESAKTFADKRGGTVQEVEDPGNPGKMLVTVNLARTQVTDADLAQTKDVTDFQGLNLHHTKVTDAGLAHLGKLIHLQTLDLSETKITNEGVGQLKDLAKLQMLHLGGTEITDKGLMTLKRLSSLQVLNLRDTKI